MPKFFDPLDVDCLSYINVVQWSPSLTLATSQTRAAPYWVVTDDSGISLTLGHTSFNGALETGISESPIRQMVTDVPDHLLPVVDFTANRCFFGAPEISKIFLAKFRFHPMKKFLGKRFFDCLICFKRRWEFHPIRNLGL